MLFLNFIREKNIYKLFEILNKYIIRIFFRNDFFINSMLWFSVLCCLISLGKYEKIYKIFQILNEYIVRFFGEMLTEISDTRQNITRHRLIIYEERAKRTKLLLASSYNFRFFLHNSKDEGDFIIFSEKYMHDAKRNEFSICYWI